MNLNFTNNLKYRTLYLLKILFLISFLVSSCTKNSPESPLIVLPPVVDGLRLANLEANMILVNGDTFTMGSTPEQLISNGDRFTRTKNDTPFTQKVTLSSYKICRFEVTQQLWQDVMSNNPSYFQDSNNGVFYGENLQRPVENVVWDSIQVFITKLNKLTGKKYRLPTEAEWEFAARGGSITTYKYFYSGGDSLNLVAWNGKNAYDSTHTVGTKLANALGIYDMSGNVWEFCNDLSSNYSKVPITNPQGGSTGSNRIIRGCGWGSFFGIYGAYRVSFRLDWPEGNEPDSGLGFRLCLSN